MKIPYQYFFVKYLPDSNSITCIDVSTVESVTTTDKEITIYLYEDEPIVAYYKYSWIARHIAKKIMKQNEKLINFNIMMKYKSLKYIPMIQDSEE